ncbi:hypothetical protein HAX54_011916 [Datura stramonium]|uniref:Uncharacterized protein n=1 Tax=Datura stramonium TaxID=4076 RepID=A0ABS8TKI7_DATST|nr:hypothetical protein [Datura stramonium]
MSSSSLNSGPFTPVSDGAMKKREERKAHPDQAIDEIIPSMYFFDNDFKIHPCGDCGWNPNKYRVEAPLNLSILLHRDLTTPLFKPIHSTWAP